MEGIDMLFRTIVKTACMFSLVAVVGCDPDVADVEAEAAQVDVKPLVTLELAADDDEADGEYISVDPSLDMRDAEGSEQAAGQCWPGSWEFQFLPSGTCGGCTISGSYPGLKYIEYKRQCSPNGNWGPFQKASQTQCVHC
jgi:hypothetical protein